MYLITNRHLCDKKKYYDIIKKCIENNIENIIIREKDLEYEELENLCTKIKGIRDDNSFIHKTKLIINSNISIYENLDMDGIHLPYDLFVKLVKNSYKFKIDKILGVSIHNIDEVKSLQHIIKNYNINISYIMLSHIFETKCKEKFKPKGIKFLKESKEITNLNIIALGGIVPENTKETLIYANDYAVMSSIMESSDVKMKIEEYRSYL